LVLSFSRSEMAVIKEIMDTLSSVGFVFGKVDDEMIEITGVPYLVANTEVGGVLDELISDFQQHSESSGFSLTDLLAKTMSRTLAVKTGEGLDPASQMALVDDLFACKEASLSPFNKAVYVTLSESDIDKKFN